MYCRTLLSGSAELTVRVAAGRSPNHLERSFKVLHKSEPGSASNMPCVPAGSCVSVATGPRRLPQEAA